MSTIDQSRTRSAKLAYAVTRELGCRYRSQLRAKTMEIYHWSTPESARRFWYLCEINGIETTIDVRGNVTVMLEVQKENGHD